MSRLARERIDNDMSKRFVAIEDHADGGMLCLGIFKDYRTAVGEIMESIWDFKDNYKNEGDIFEYTEPEIMEGEGGEIMTVRFKRSSWKEERKQYYYILLAD